MITKLGLNGADNDADLSGEGSVLELGDHLAAAECAQITAALLGGAGGNALGCILKSLAAVDGLQNGNALGLFLDQDMLGRNGLALLEELGILFIESLAVGIGDFDRGKDLLHGQLGQDLAAGVGNELVELLGLIQLLFLAHHGIEVEGDQLVDALLTEGGVLGIHLLLLGQALDEGFQLGFGNVDVADGGNDVFVRHGDRFLSVWEKMILLL